MPGIHFTMPCPIPPGALLIASALSLQLLTITMIYNLQVGPRTPTPILAATTNTEMVQSSQTFSESKQSASKEISGTAEPVAGPSAVAVDMESADVRAERDRVAGMTSFEDDCIVIKDLRKVYPPQVGLGVHACVCIVWAYAHAAMCDAILALLPSTITQHQIPHPPLIVTCRMVKYGCFLHSIQFAVLHRNH